MEEIEAHQRTDAALQRAKEIAEAANVAKTRYLVGISHEIRTPLNSISGYAQLMERNTGAPPENAVRVIRRSCRASVQPHRRAARHFAHRERPAAAEPRQSAAGRIPGSAGRHVPPAGRRQGHQLPLPAAAAPAAVRAYRPEAAAADPDQPALERHQVHRGAAMPASSSAIAARWRNSRCRTPASASTSQISSASSNPSSAAGIRRCAPFRAPASA